MSSKIKLPEIKSIYDANRRLKNVVSHTPLIKNLNFSDIYKANILFKREDLQIVRSYKIRGAYNKISSLSDENLVNGVICASAGNHAQGVAYACNNMNINGKIYMPTTTPSQKIKQVKMFGKKNVEIILVGDSYDDSQKEALVESKRSNISYIPPFNDIKVIEGQATVGLEILKDANEIIDYLFIPIGGGGLAAGVGSFFKQISPNTKIIGIEPEGAPAMKKSLEKGELVTLDKINTFVDGAAVKKVGDLTFNICKRVIDDMITVPEGKICTTILKLYNEEAIVVEPAGAMTITALDYYKDEIVGKNVVCIVSGSNNDITRTEEIKERSMLYEGLKHYFLVRFPQRSGALKEFVVDILGSTDDITHFEYKKKNNRAKGPALIGVEVKKEEHFIELLKRMDEKNFGYEYLNDQSYLFQYIL